MLHTTGDVEGARASFTEGLRLNPGYAQLYHAYAKMEGKLANWGALNELNAKAKAAFPMPEQPNMVAGPDDAPLRGLGSA